MLNPMMLQNLQALKANPMQFLQKRFNLPQNIPMNDPQQIMNYLLQTNQISQQQVNAAYSAMQQFK